MAESKTKAKTDADKKASEKAVAGTETRQAVQPQVALHAQYIKDFPLKSPSSPDVFLNQPGQPNVEVAVNVAQPDWKIIILKCTENRRDRKNR